MDLTINVDNPMRSAAERMGALPDALKGAMRRGTASGTRVLEAGAKRTINRKTGRTAETINTELVNDPVGFPGVVAAGRVYSEDPVATYLEYGTQPHEIRPINKKALKFEVGGRTVFARSVHHPGTRPYLWLDKAVVESDAEIGRGYDEAVREAMS